jgi:hypothetical protein
MDTTLAPSALPRYSNSAVSRYPDNARVLRDTCEQKVMQSLARLQDHLAYQYAGAEKTRIAKLISNCRTGQNVAVRTWCDLTVSSLAIKAPMSIALDPLYTIWGFARAKFGKAPTRSLEDLAHAETVVDGKFDLVQLQAVTSHTLTPEKCMEGLELCRKLHDLIGEYELRFERILATTPTHSLSA